MLVVTRTAGERAGASGAQRVRPPYTCGEMSNPAAEPVPTETIELSVEELLRRARPHRPYGEMVIDDLDADEADAFLAAVLS